MLKSSKQIKSLEHTQEEINFAVDQEMEDWLDKNPDSTDEEYSEARKRAEKYVRRMLGSSKMIKSSYTSWDDFYKKGCKLGLSSYMNSLDELHDKYGRFRDVPKEKLSSILKNIPNDITYEIFLFVEDMLDYFDWHDIIDSSKAFKIKSSGKKDRYGFAFLSESDKQNYLDQAGGDVEKAQILYERDVENGPIGPLDEEEDKFDQIIEIGSSCKSEASDWVKNAIKKDHLFDNISKLCSDLKAYPEDKLPPNGLYCKLISCKMELDGSSKLEAEKMCSSFTILNWVDHLGDLLKNF